MSAMTFGQKLRELRRKTYKTQTEVVTEIEELFGSHIHISQTTLSNLELRASLPKGEIVELFAAYFEVPVSYFYDGESPVLSKAEQQLSELITITFAQLTDMIVHIDYAETKDGTPIMVEDKLPFRRGANVYFYRSCEKLESTRLDETCRVLFTDYKTHIRAAQKSQAAVEAFLATLNETEADE